MIDNNTIASGMLNKKSKDYLYSDDVINRLFFNNIGKADILNSHDIFISPETKTNSEFFYKLNSLNYRSKEFYNSPDIIFSGCSFTYGMGLEENNLWTEMFSKKVGMNGINLGLPGKSVSSIINNIYAYIRDYGKPKHIVCLFPNFNRFELTINKNIMISQRNISEDKYNSSPLYKKTEIDSGAYLQDIIMDSEPLSDKPKYSKKPHIAEDVLPPDLLYWTAIKQILAFEQYCKEANIKLMWTTWDKELNLAINLIKDRYLNQYTNYVLLDDGYDLDCHQDQMTNEFLWENAGDRDRGINYSHPGIHFHIHVAEAFYKAMSIDEI